MSSRFFQRTIVAIIESRAVCGVVVGTALVVAACAPTTPSSTPATSVAATTSDTPLRDTSTANGVGPQACVPDRKLLGRFEVSVDERPGTWWYLTKQRFDSLGVTDYKAALEGFFGRQFADLAAAIQFLIDGLRTFDKNGNGYVCGYLEPGTKANFGDNAQFLFGVADDKHAE